MDTLDTWTRFVASATPDERTNLMESLRRANSDADPELPDFVTEGAGESLLEWARRHKASYTLMQEITLASKKP